MNKSKNSEFSKEFQDVARFAKALSHPARLAILETLAEKNSCICGEIVEVMPLSQSTVSQHLKELKDAGIIQGEIQGPASCYCINYINLKKNFELLSKLIKNCERSEAISSSCNAEIDSSCCP
jgi:DNA-binding transcriptional ArsR family regulator